MNQDTEKILQTYIVDYLTHHPTIVSQYLSENGLWHIYARTKDEFSTNEGRGKKQHHEIFYIKSCVTMNEAETWILQHGKKVVNDEEDNYGVPIVLTIVYDDNKGKYYTGEHPANAYEISSQMYPTFTFSKKGYDMLLTEIQVGEEMHREFPSDKAWIRYIK